MRNAIMVVCLLGGLSSCVTVKPEKFLCGFSGGLASAGQDCLLTGRRFTLEERGRARARISAVLNELDLTPKTHLYNTAWLGAGANLYAELPATVPSDAWVVVGAHYDTVRDSPGADDDGSGVTTVLLVAEALTKLKHRRVNVLFVFFDQEEEGTIGSEAFVERLKAGGRKVIAAHCIDMVGWDGDGDRTVEIAHGPDPVPGTGELFVRLYRSAATRTEGAGPIMRTDMGRSDHEAFIARGIPAVMISEEHVGGDSTPHYHKPTDTCDTINHPYLQMVARLVAAAITEQVK